MFKLIKEDIQVVFERDPAARSAIEILTACPGLHAILLHRINHYLWRKKIYLLARWGSYIARFLTGVEIHPGATIGRRFFIDHGMGIVIGETAEIDDDCSIYHGVTLGGTTWNKGKRHPTLENNVIIGAGAKVLGPITLGKDARVGSNAVVVKDVPTGATIVGLPGNIIVKKEAEREAMAKKIGFAAYGESKDMLDPAENVIQSMLDRMHTVDEELEVLKKKLNKEKD